LTTPKKVPSFPCPQCSRVFLTVTGRGSHMRGAHQVIGTSAASIAAQKKAAGKDTLPCPHCDFKAATLGGLSLHLKRAHGIAKSFSKKLSRRNQIERQADQAAVLLPTKTEAREAQPEGNSDGIPDALVAVASGRFIELCRSMAFEYDLPPRLFAARVAAFVYGTSVR
jgi:uncharacterized C2H2 Zn-finger protein